MILRILCLMAIFAAFATPQMTTNQKLDNFRNLVGLYDKNYAPYEWRRDVIGFDPLNIGPWTDLVKQSKTDLDFFEICVRHVASLNDAHDLLTLPSTFSANLGFRADVYDGKVLVDMISLRVRAAYPLQIQKPQYFELPGEHTVVGSGAVTPAFALPANFVQRLSGPYYLSGTFVADGLQIGFIRIPTWAIYEEAIPLAVKQFEDEIRFFQQNTDGLVIDQMRNPGGNACTYQMPILARLIPYPTRKLGLKYRATWETLLSAAQALDQARADGASQAYLDALQNFLSALRTAFAQNRGRTDAFPMCGDPGWNIPPAVDSVGNMIAYTKPLLVLVDEFDASASDIFAATIQDNQRGPLFGWRTMGAGGAPASFSVGAYSEGTMTRISEALFVRQPLIETEDFPPTHYMENVGARPDIVEDYMTEDNLLNQGRPFVAAFTRAIVELIRSSQ